MSTNVWKFRKKIRKISDICLEGLKTQFSDIFWTIFAYSVDAFVCGAIHVHFANVHIVFRSWGFPFGGSSSSGL